MTSARVNFSVGLFMTAGLGLATLAIIWLGMSSFLRKGEVFVTYFDESVQGLAVDSPVKYRGVPVGRVQAIRIAPDYHLIEVVLQIDDEHASDEKRFENTVAALSNVGITGAMFVEIDRARGLELERSPKLSFDPSYPVIASKPSEIKKLFQEIDSIATQISSIDFKGISEQAMAAFTSVDVAVRDAQLGAISKDMRALLATLNKVAEPKRMEAMATNLERTLSGSRRLMEKATAEIDQMDLVLQQIQGTIAANRPHLDTTMAAMAATAVKADSVMTQGQRTMLQMQSTIRELETRLAVTSENLATTAENLNALITNVKDQPSQLLFSDPRQPREVEP